MVVYCTTGFRWRFAGSATGVALAISALLLLLFWTSQPHTSELKIHSRQGVHTFKVEVAETNSARRRGLMARKHLNQDEGLLIVYGEPREMRMWMKDTPLTLDMIFIRQDGTVHRVEPQVAPFSEHTVYSQGAVVACLELLGGSAEKIGLAEGDRVQHPSLGRYRD